MTHFNETIKYSSKLFDNYPMIFNHDEKLHDPFVKDKSIFSELYNYKASGIIPYTYIDNKLHFLLQKLDNPTKKYNGWNDFGGRKINYNSDDFIIYNPDDNDGSVIIENNSMITACREFCEETSCLFYLNDIGLQDAQYFYDIYKDRKELDYDQIERDNLKKIINIGTKYYKNKLKNNLQLRMSCDGVYICYLMPVEYIPASDIPHAEDIHINRIDRYNREVKWFRYDDLLAINDHLIHKRLRLVKLKNKLKKFIDKCLI